MHNTKHSKIHIIGVSEKREREWKIFFDEIMAKVFPKLRENYIQVQEAQIVPHKMNSNSPIARHVLKMTQVKCKG